MITFSFKEDFVIIYSQTFSGIGSMYVISSSDAFSSTVIDSN